MAGTLSYWRLVGNDGIYFGVEGLRAESLRLVGKKATCYFGIINCFYSHLPY